MDSKISDFWQKDFWNPPDEKQAHINDFGKAERLRKIERDFTAINQSHQWEPHHFLNILDKAINTLNLPDGYKGTGRRSIPLRDKIKIGCIKQYHLKGARRSVYYVENARNNHYLLIPTISKNYFNRINDYIKDKSLRRYVQQLITRLSEPLAQSEHCFAVDGTGFKISSGKTRYKDIRTNKRKKREYIGLHAICGVNSHIVPYAIVAKGYEHDNKFFKKLILETLKKFDINEIYADSAYLSKENVEFCKSLNIKCFIKPKENTLMKGLKNSAWNEHLKRFYEDMDKKENRRYSLRANIESTFNMLKSIFTDVLRHKTFDARVNEVLFRMVCHNIRCLVLAYYHNEIDFPFQID